MSSPITTAPKPYVFVLMPFSDEFADIYEAGIKQACKDAGAYCERVDEQIFEGSITQRIYNQIAKADIIVADMTGRNANVFYETGYAHALNKRVILLTQKVEDIPFDLKDYPHIVYEGRIAGLKRELERRIRWWVDNPTRSLKSIESDIEVYIERSSSDDYGVQRAENVILVNRPVLTYYKREYQGMKQNYFVSLSFYNPTDHIITDIPFGLISHPAFSELYSSAASSSASDRWDHKAVSIPLPDGLILHQVRTPIGDLLPQSWRKLDLMFYWLCYVDDQDSYDFLLRLFTPLGTKDYPYILKVIPSPSTRNS